MAIKVTLKEGDNRRTEFLLESLSKLVNAFNESKVEDEILSKRIHTLGFGMLMILLSDRDSGYIRKVFESKTGTEGFVYDSLVSYNNEQDPNMPDIVFYNGDYYQETRVNIMGCNDMYLYSIMEIDTLLSFHNE